jgi:hypothetical protein
MRPLGARQLLDQGERLDLDDGDGVLAAERAVGANHTLVVHGPRLGSTATASRSEINGS